MHHSRPHTISYKLAENGSVFAGDFKGGRQLEIVLIYLSKKINKPQNNNKYSLNLYSWGVELSEFDN